MLQLMARPASILGAAALTEQSRQPIHIISLSLNERGERNTKKSLAASRRTLLLHVIQ